jgi:hypothetical protein
MRYAGIELRILTEDALSYRSDLLVLKYAQNSFGVDLRATDAARINPVILPNPGRTLLIKKPTNIASENLMFIGTESIGKFDYRSIRDFSRRALAAAGELDYSVREIALTLHGVGFGLDETEAFESEVAGIVEAIDTEKYPRRLRAVTFLELKEDRARRLRTLLRELIGPTSVEHLQATEGTTPTKRRLDTAGYDSATRPHAFVAMPFEESFNDIFYYGIAPSVRAAGFLCERIDQIAFTGDIIDRMKEKIRTAVLVVADLSGANSNVYLEVGYAWGRGIPCVLICDRDTNLKFDVRGQRCLFYKSIRELEDQLSTELRSLSDQLAT